jgi:hypothetical protein
MGSMRTRTHTNTHTHTHTHTQVVEVCTEPHGFMGKNLLHGVIVPRNSLVAGITVPRNSLGNGHALRTEGQVAATHWPRTPPIPLDSSPALPRPRPMSENHGESERQSTGSSEGELLLKYSVEGAATVPADRERERASERALLGTDMFADGFPADMFGEGFLKGEEYVEDLTLHGDSSQVPDSVLVSVSVSVYTSALSVSVSVSTSVSDSVFCLFMPVCLSEPVCMCARASLTNCYMSFVFSRTICVCPWYRGKGITASDLAPVSSECDESDAPVSSECDDSDGGVG